MSKAPDYSLTPEQAMATLSESDYAQWYEGYGEFLCAEHDRKFANWEEPETLHADQEWPDWMHDRHHFTLEINGVEIVSGLSRYDALGAVERLRDGCRYKGEFRLFSGYDGRELQTGYIGDE